MATRRQIKNAFLSEIESAVDGTTYPRGGSDTFTKDDVYLKGQEGEASNPIVVYEEFGFPVSYNRGSEPAPVDYEMNNSGEVTGEIYLDFGGLRFDVTIQGSELDKEPIFQSISDRFSEFNTWRDETDLHADVIDISTRGFNSPDENSTEDTTRVDVATVEIEYKIFVTKSGIPIRTITTTADADNDGTLDTETYETT